MKTIARLSILTAALVAAVHLPALAAPSKAAVEAQFENWVQTELRPEAEKNGISAKTFRSAFAGIELNWDLPDLAPPGFPPPKERKQTQAEFSSPRDDRRERR